MLHWASCFSDQLMASQDSGPDPALWGEEVDDDVGLGESSVVPDTFGEASRISQHSGAGAAAGAADAGVASSTLPLSDEQQRVVALVDSGRSVFFTGSAGVSRTVFVRAVLLTFVRHSCRWAKAGCYSTSLNDLNSAMELYVISDSGVQHHSLLAFNHRVLERKWR